MIQENDWRLFGQQKYLQGATLEWKRYHQYAPNPNWDHDHCSFCMAKFMDLDEPEILREGYTTLGAYYWICKTCFDDFHELFQWNIIRDRQVYRRINYLFVRVQHERNVFLHHPNLCQNKRHLEIHRRTHYSGHQRINTKIF